MVETSNHTSWIRYCSKHTITWKYVDFLLLIAFNPTTTDIKEYSKVLDANGDGAVNLADLEALAVQYLCGDGVLSGLNKSKASEGVFNQSNYSGSSLPNKAGNDYLNYSSSQNVQRISGGEK